MEQLHLLGELLLQLQFVSAEQIQEAVTEQANNPSKKIGEILIEKGYITPEFVEKALALQKIFRTAAEFTDRTFGEVAKRREFLKQVPLFRELKDNELEKIASICKEEAISAGTLIFREGEEGDALYIITKGSVKIDKALPRGEETLAVLTVGDFFGEMAMIDNFPRSASATTQREASVLIIKKLELDELLERDHEIARKLYKIFARTLSLRLRETDEKLKATIAEHQKAASPIRHFFTG